MCIWPLRPLGLLFYSKIYRLLFFEFGSFGVKLFHFFLAFNPSLCLLNIMLCPHLLRDHWYLCSETSHIESPRSHWREQIGVLIYIDDNDKISSHICVTIISITLKFHINVLPSMPYKQVKIIFQKFHISGKILTG